MMFGRKKKQRILTDWPSLQDALIAFFDATQTASGGMELVVSWKAEKRSQTVNVTYAAVNGLGPLAFVSAPIGTIDDDEYPRLLSHVSPLLVGGLARDENGVTCLRATLPFDGVNFEVLAQTIRQLASGADELKAGRDS